MVYISIWNWNLPQSDDFMDINKVPPYMGDSGCCLFNHCWPLGARAQDHIFKNQWIPTREEHEMMLHWESQWQAQDPFGW